MIALQRALERTPAGANTRAAGHTRLFGLCRAGVVSRSAVVHETIILLFSLLATPHPPGEKTNDSKDDGATNTDNDADDRVTCLR